jgi:hypothetical protein
MRLLVFKSPFIHIIFVGIKLTYFTLRRPFVVQNQGCRMCHWIGTVLTIAYIENTELLNSLTVLTTLSTY